MPNCRPYLEVLDKLQSCIRVAALQAVQDSRSGGRRPPLSSAQCRLRLCRLPSSARRPLWHRQSTSLPPSNATHCLTRRPTAASRPACHASRLSPGREQTQTPATAASPPVHAVTQSHRHRSPPVRPPVAASVGLLLCVSVSASVVLLYLRLRCEWLESVIHRMLAGVVHLG